MNNLVYIAHHGIKGQKWGIRRFQNSDGSLTEQGKTRYGKKLGRYAAKLGDLSLKAVEYRATDSARGPGRTSMMLRVDRYNKAAEKYNKLLDKLVKKYGEKAVVDSVTEYVNSPKARKKKALADYYIKIDALDAKHDSQVLKVQSMLAGNKITEERASQMLNDAWDSYVEEVNKYDAAYRKEIENN